MEIGALPVEAKHPQERGAGMAMKERGKFRYGYVKRLADIRAEVLR
jgi:hypothetical protein